MLTALALLAKRRQRLSEFLETVEPDIAEFILIDISLYKLRSFLDIKACSDVAVYSYRSRMCTGTAIEEPVSYFSLVFKAEIMRAAVTYGNALLSLSADKVKDISLLFIAFIV